MNHKRRAQNLLRQFGSIWSPEDVEIVATKLRQVEREAYQRGEDDTIARFIARELKEKGIANTRYAGSRSALFVLAGRTT